MPHTATAQTTLSLLEMASFSNLDNMKSTKILRTHCLIFCLLMGILVSCSEKPNEAKPLLGKWDVDIQKTVDAMPKDSTSRGDFLRVGIQFRWVKDKMVFATVLDGYPQREAIVKLISHNGSTYEIEILTEIEYNPNRIEGSTTGVRSKFTLIDENHLKMETPSGVIYYKRKS